MGASCKPSSILFGILAGIGVFVMLAVGTTVVKEYILAKSFQNTECRLQDVTDLGNQTCQYCYSTSSSSRRSRSRGKRGTRCRPSSFPCVRVAASFHDAFRDNHNATYFPDVIQMSEGLMCSFYNCGPSYTSNAKQVRANVKHLMDTHRTHPFPCFYSTLHPGKVIGRKIYSFDSALHGMLWPALITGVALIGILVTMFSLHQRFRTNHAPVELATVSGSSRLSVIRNDDCSEGATGGSSNHEKMPLKAPPGGAEVNNSMHSSSVTAPPPYQSPVGFASSTDALHFPHRQAESSNQTYPHHQPPYPVSDHVGPVLLPPAADTMYPPPPQTDQALPSAPPPSYSSVFNR